MNRTNRYGLAGRVSVVIPVYNRGIQIKEAVMSVLLQTYEDLELIIVDDGSSDDTQDVVKDIEVLWPYTVRIYRQANSGPGFARQLGTDHAEGEFIQYLDSDDIICLEKLAMQVTALQTNPDCDICYGLSYQEDYSFQPPILIGPMRDTGLDIRYLFPKLLNERWWTTSCPLYRKNLLDRIGPWKEYLNEEDWEFDARAGSTRTLLTWIPKVVSMRRIHISDDHLSSQGFTDHKKMRDRIKAKYDIYSSATDAGVNDLNPEMLLFSRECFQLARQCSALGLDEEAASIIQLAVISSAGRNRFQCDVLMYRMLGQLIGWARIGGLTRMLRRMLK